jgi:hypothetical protein
MALRRPERPLGSRGAASAPTASLPDPRRRRPTPFGRGYPCPIVLPFLSSGVGHVPGNHCCEVVGAVARVPGSLGCAHVAEEGS